jgi:hypothetical protein
MKSYKLLKAEAQTYHNGPLVNTEAESRQSIFFGLVLIDRVGCG